MLERKMQNLIAAAAMRIFALAGPKLVVPASRFVVKFCGCRQSEESIVTPALSFPAKIQMQ
jgi:hypothetical protein